MVPSSANRLIHQKSPYLLQHAHNPVDWFPWGEEAFEKARREDKPVLVSIGYSTCHWCHVMEKESYEDPAIGALMNDALVNIKVDREERPDVDKIYITAVSAMTGSAGWPLNVFLTPDRQPFYGGTYFPPLPRWGQPAWRDVVQHISHSWKNPEERKKLLTSGREMTEALKHYMTSVTPPIEGDPAWLDKAYHVFSESFDALGGGFSPAPKFPMPVYHNFLLRYYARTKHRQALDMVLVTLREMAKGGIYDQLGGGFARYSTDADWHIPHFEKMLYDNAQLVTNYLEAYQITREPDLRRIAEETLFYIQRDMTHPEGGFYSAEDADSLASSDAQEKKEGAFYVWEKREIESHLTPQEAELFCFRYGVREQGNAKQDPHQEFSGKNILYAAHPIPETARQFQIPDAVAHALLAGAQQKLLALRSRRPRPHLDDKVLSGWNGLMISAWAKAAQILKHPEAIAVAQKAATFLKKNLYDAAAKTLFRSWRDGQRSGPGIADDYAFVAQSMLDLYETDFNAQWLIWAEELMDQMLQRFYDAEHGGFFMTATDQDRHLLLRVKEDADNVEPAASSVAVSNLLRLYPMTNRADFEAAAQKTLRSYGAILRDQPRAMPTMLAALDLALHEPDQIVIAGKRQNHDTQALLDVIHDSFYPNKVIMLVDGEQNHSLKSVGGKATVYICSARTCQPPIVDSHDLSEKLIQGLRPCS